MHQRRQSRPVTSAGERIPSLWPAGTRRGSEILRIAHRGGAGSSENYRSVNLDRLAAVGMHLVEVDLRTTRDGRIVAWHDPAAPATGVLRPVAAHTLTEWRTWLPDGRMPELAALLTATRLAGLGLYLDIKDVTGHRRDELVGQLTATRMSDRAIIAADDPDVVHDFARLAPRIPRAVLIRDVNVDPISIGRAAEADFVHPCWEAHDRPDRLLTPSWTGAVRSAGLGIVCWHEERREVLTGLRAIGVDGICTDDPELLSAVLSTDGARSGVAEQRTVQQARGVGTERHHVDDQP